MNCPCTTSAGNRHGARAEHIFITTSSYRKKYNNKCSTYRFPTPPSFVVNISLVWHIGSMQLLRREKKRQKEVVKSVNCRSCFFPFSYLHVIWWPSTGPGQIPLTEFWGGCLRTFLTAAFEFYARAPPKLPCEGRQATQLRPILRSSKCFWAHLETCNCSLIHLTRNTHRTQIGAARRQQTSFRCDSP